MSTLQAVERNSLLLPCAKNRATLLQVLQAAVVSAVMLKENVERCRRAAGLRMDIWLFMRMKSNAYRVWTSTQMRVALDLLGSSMHMAFEPVSCICAARCRRQ